MLWTEYWPSESKWKPASRFSDHVYRVSIIIDVIMDLELPFSRFRSKNLVHGFVTWIIINLYPDWKYQNVIWIKEVECNNTFWNKTQKNFKSVDRRSNLIRSLSSWYIDLLIIYIYCIIRSLIFNDR